jgi:hypothetical protein
MTGAAPTHDAAALTEHIETRYHARHRAQLPEFAALVEKHDPARAAARLFPRLGQPDRGVGSGRGLLRNHRCRQRVLEGVGGRTL